MTHFTLTVENDEDDHGIWYITSSDAVPSGRLFIAQKSLATALAAVPECIEDLKRAAALDGLPLVSKLEGMKMRTGRPTPVSTHSGMENDCEQEEGA